MNLITCSPGPSFFGVTDLSSHNIAHISEHRRAVEQHQKLIQTIEETGTSVLNLPELPGHPNSVFTKDTAICTQMGYVKVRMGLPSRWGEEQWMAEVLDRSGVPLLGAIEEPGTVEGGDVILAEKVAFLGNSSRTNASGVKQLSLLLSHLGFEIRSTPVPPPFLHLGGAFTLVAPDTILCVRGLFPDRFFEGFHRIEVPHTGFISGNVIPLPNRQIIAEQSNVSAADLLRNHDFIVHTLDLSEFVKGNGGPSCLIL